MAIAEIKGSTLQLRLQYIANRWGERSLQRVLGKLAPEDAETIRHALPIGWYPLALNARFDEMICAELAAGDEGVYLALGVYSAEKLSEQIYGAYFDERSPENFLKATTDLYPLHYRNGGKRDEFPEPGRAVVLFTDVIETFRPNCMTNVGFMRRGLELIGCLDVTSRESQCNLDTHDGTCRFELQWTPARSR